MITYRNRREGDLYLKKRRRDGQGINISAEGKKTYLNTQIKKA